MIAIGNFRYLQTGALSFLTITCKMKSQKHASRFDLRYDTYSGLWCHKPVKELGFECDFVKLAPHGIKPEFVPNPAYVIAGHRTARLLPGHLGRGQEGCLRSEIGPDDLPGPRCV